MVIIVLMGGVSSEKEISLLTGQAVLAACRRLGHRADPCYYDGDLESLPSRVKECDVVFTALHGGDGENGMVQAVLDRAQIRYTGSGPEASSLAMDKRRTKELLAKKDLPTPPWISLGITDRNVRDLPAKRFGFPVVVKPNAEGSTVGLSIVRKAADFEMAVKLAFEFGEEIVVEQYIPGRELTVGILGDTPLPIIEIKPKHDVYDYACKYTAGMTEYFCPAPLEERLTKAIQVCTSKIVNLLRCRHYSRVDFRLDPSDRFWCLEVNTLPGMTATSLVPKAAAAAGMPFDEMIRKILEQSARG